MTPRPRHSCTDPAAALAALLALVVLAGCGAALVPTAARDAGGGPVPLRSAARGSGLPASSTTVQPQPPPGSCRARGSGPLTEPDQRCTPGATNPTVTQATIRSTICRSGWTRTIRPPEAVTQQEKRASMAAYGDAGRLSAFEFDDAIPLELGGAPNDARNLWPEPGGRHNPKDTLENKLKMLVCSGALPLTRAQRLIATDWVAAYRQYVAGG